MTADNGFHISRLDEAVELRRRLELRQYEIVVLNSGGEISIFARPPKDTKDLGTGANFSEPDANLRKTLIDQVHGEIARIEEALRGMGIDPGTPPPEESPSAATPVGNQHE